MYCIIAKALIWIRKTIQSSNDSNRPWKIACKTHLRSQARTIFSRKPRVKSVSKNNQSKSNAMVRLGHMTRKAWLPLVRIQICLRHLFLFLKIKVRMRERVFSASLSSHDTWAKDPCLPALVIFSNPFQKHFSFQEEGEVHRTWLQSVFCAAETFKGRARPISLSKTDQSWKFFFCQFIHLKLESACNESTDKSERESPRKAVVVKYSPLFTGGALGTVPLLWLQIEG